MTCRPEDGVDKGVVTKQMGHSFYDYDDREWGSYAWISIAPRGRD